jgi:hypothetical protein
MSEIRIKLQDHLRDQWTAAATLRGLSLTSFIIATVSEVLLSKGEITAALRYTPHPIPNSDAPASTPKPEPAPLFPVKHAPVGGMTGAQSAAALAEWGGDDDDE